MKNAERRQYDFGRAVVGEKIGKKYVLSVAGDIITCGSFSALYRLGRQYGDDAHPKISVVKQ